MNHESLVEKYLGITNYHTEKIPLPPPSSLISNKMVRNGKQPNLATETAIQKVVTMATS